MSCCPLKWNVLRPYFKYLSFICKSLFLRKYDTECENATSLSLGGADEAGPTNPVSLKNGCRSSE